MSDWHIDWSAISTIVAAGAIAAAVWVGRQPAKLAKADLARRNKTAAEAIAAILDPVLSVAEAVRASREKNASTLPSDALVNKLRLRAREALRRLKEFDAVWRDLSTERHTAFLRARVVLKKVARTSQKWLDGWGKTELRQMALLAPRMERQREQVGRLIAAFRSDAKLHDLRG